MTTIEQRIGHLERDCSRLRAWNWCLLIAGIAAVCISAAPATPPKQLALDDVAPDDRQAGPAKVQADRDRQPLTIEAERLILFDAQRRPRLVMSVAEEGPTVSLLDSQGNPRVALSESSAWSGLQLMDGQGQPIGAFSVPSDTQQAQLELRRDQGSTLARSDGYFVRDSKDHNSAYLALINGNFPVCGVTGPGSQGPPAVEITSSEGTGRIKIHDVHGRPLFTVGTTGTGSAELTLSQSGSERSFSIAGGTLGSEGPTVTFFGPSQPDGSGGILPRMVLGIGGESQPFIRISDADGNRAYSVPPQDGAK